MLPGWLRPAHISWWERLTSISFQLCVEWCHASSLELAIMGVFTQGNQVNTTNKSLFPPRELVTKHLLPHCCRLVSTSLLSLSAFPWKQPIVQWCWKRPLLTWRAWRRLDSGIYKDFSNWRVFIGEKMWKLGLFTFPDNTGAHLQGFQGSHNQGEGRQECEFPVIVELNGKTVQTFHSIL